MKERMLLQIITSITIDYNKHLFKNSVSWIKWKISPKYLKNYIKNGVCRALIYKTILKKKDNVGRIILPAFSLLQSYGINRLIKA